MPRINSSGRILLSDDERFQLVSETQHLISVEDMRFLAFMVDRAIKHQYQLINDLINSNVFIEKEKVIKEESNYLKRLKYIKDKLPLPEPPKEDK